jgi:amino acid transporter
MPEEQKSEPKVFKRKATGLVREATLLDTFLFNGAAATFGGLIVLFGLYITGLPGGNVLAALPILLITFSIGIVYSFLTATMPRSGGDYVFNSRILHPSIAYAFNFALVVLQTLYIGFMLWFIWQTGFGPAFYLIGYQTHNIALQNLGTWVSVPINSLLLGTILNIVYGFIAVSGIKNMLKLVNVVQIITLVATGIGVAVFAFTPNSTFINLFNNFIHSSDSSLATVANPYQSVISAAATQGFHTPSLGISLPLLLPLLPFLAAGVMWTFYAAYFAGEIKNANSVKRNLTSMVGAAAFNLVFIGLMFYFFMQSVGYHFMSSISYMASTPGILPSGFGGVTWIATYFFGLVAQNPILAAIIVFGMTFSISSAVMIPVIAIQIQRNMFGWSIDRLAPDKMSEVNPKYHSPVFTIAMSVIFYEIALSFEVYLNYSNPSLVGGMYAMGILGPALACMLLPGISAIVLPWRRKELYNASPAKIEIRGFPIIVIFGIIEIIWVAILTYEFLVWPVYGLLTYPLFAVLAFVPFLIGFILYWAIRAYRKRQGIDIDLACAEIPPA